MIIRPAFFSDSGQWNAVNQQEFEAVAAVSRQWRLSVGAGPERLVATLPKGETASARSAASWMLPLEAPDSAPRLPNVDGRLMVYQCSGQMPFRPLVGVLDGGVADPDKWTEAEAPPVSDQLWQEIRRVISVIDRERDCNERGDSGVPFDYAARDVVVDASFRDRRGRYLVRIHVAQRGRGCRGIADRFGSYWFAIDSVATYLAQWTSWMSAGDFDGDGRSEIAFFGADNEPGYLLLLGDLRTRVNLHVHWH